MLVHKKDNGQSKHKDPACMTILIVPVNSMLAISKNNTLEHIIRQSVVVYDSASEIWEKASSVFEKRELSFQTFIQTDSSESVKKFLTWSVARKGPVAGRKEIQLAVKYSQINGFAAHTDNGIFKILNESSIHRTPAFLLSSE